MFCFYYFSDDSATLRKSPKRDFPCDELSGSAVEKRASTPDFESQEPCTSKQSHSPDKYNNKHSTADTAALPSSSTASVKQTTTSTSSSSNSSPSSGSKQQCSSFYQELLEASYANDG